MSLGLSRRGVLAGVGAGLGAGFGLAHAQPAGSDPRGAFAQLLAETPADPSGAKTFVDPLSDAFGAERLRAARSAAARLAAIDRARLSPVDQLAYDVLSFQAGEIIRDFDSGVFAIRQSTPLDASFGPQVSFPDEASSSTGLVTVADYEAGLARLVAFAGYMTATVERLKAGVAKGYLQPRVLVRNVLAQVDVMLASPPEATPFYRPLISMPPAIAPPEQARLRAAYLQVIRAQVLPGYGLWERYLGETYLPLAREAPGLWAMKDGALVYATALRHHTTTDLGAEDIHRLGLSEVARIRGELEAVRATIGYPGDLQALFSHVRSDRSFYYSRPEDLLARFREIEARIWQGIPRLFARRPTAPFEVRPLPTLGEARGTGYYQLGKPDGRSPGVLYFNMSMLSTRPIPTLETLTLHEGIPGHHFQGSLAQENTALPDILRFSQDRFTAYAEGWGLYSESLGKALGMFTDPYQWFGHLDFEMLRAVRLVVDTGMHAKGWSRERAIAFMTDNTSMAAKDIAVEIDRYISDPGQATAYKVGELKLLELRTRAQGALGPRFDIKRYHDQVLMTGALPLRVLEAKIDGWIAAGGPAWTARA
jgi:uncharacterized protein (DUF885 family)